jgi:hypothetical protein
MLSLLLMRLKAFLLTFQDKTHQALFELVRDILAINFVLLL